MGPGHMEVMGRPYFFAPPPMPQPPSDYTPPGPPPTRRLSGKGLRGKSSVKLGGTLYLRIHWSVGACTSQDEYMDFLVCKELLLRGNLPHSSLHACPAINNLTSTLIPLEVKACERISAMLHNKRMLAVPAASTLERHSIYEIARPPPFQFIATRGIRDGQRPIQCLIQLKQEPVNVDF
jgi:hypothetical protein